MFYGKSNQRQEVNLNSSAFISYSDTAMVTAGYWNRQLSLQIKPCVGQDANGVRQYAEDKNQYVSTSITQENAICLIEGFEKLVIPALNGTAEKGAASVIMGNPDNRKILTIGYENKIAYLSVATGLDEKGKATSEIRHTFNKKEYLENYKASEGNAEIHTVEVELINFMKKVRSIETLDPAIPHAIKYNEMVRSTYGGNNSNRGGNNMNTGMNTPTEGYSAPVSNANSMEDFLPFS